MKEKVIGELPRIVTNADGLYEGNLVPYFRHVFHNAQNLFRPYHNFRHMFHVLWQCYNAGLFYKDKLTPREIRNLLIAAMFHDYDHPGMMGHDDLNITRALRGLVKQILEEDKPFIGDISILITATQFPYAMPSESLDLSGQIIRDADMTQALSVAWIQQVIFGLADEWTKKPIEILRMQVPFLRNLKFHTEWARQLFPQEAIDAKIRESEELLKLLELPPAPTA